MAKQYPTRSRILRKIERKSKKNLVLAFLGIVVVVFAVFKIGIPLLAQISLFIENLRPPISEVQKESLNFLQAPFLDPLPIATNSSPIKLTGLAIPKKEVEIFVGQELVNKVTSSEDGKFEIPSLKLQEGENSLRARVKDNSQQSEFSEGLTIILDQKPPPLDVTNPTASQAFSKDQSKIEVKGKTEGETRVTINDSRAIVDSEGNFSYLFQLITSGENKIQIKAVDLAGNETVVERTVTFSP